ncbi:MAG: ComF family protein [Candidatus Thorarchaeota archaeon]
MGKYVPRNRRTDDDLLDLSEDLWNAKRDRSLSLLLGAVLAAFVENEHPMLLRYSVVTTVPSFEPPGHTEYLLEAFCYNTSHDGCRTDLLTKTMDISLTGKPRDRRRELAPRIYHAGLGQVSHGSTVLILDDILTDGATMDRCASVLREMGASRVVGLVVARTV